MWLTHAWHTNEHDLTKRRLDTVFALKSNFKWLSLSDKPCTLISLGTKRRHLQK